MWRFPARHSEPAGASGSIVGGLAQRLDRARGGLIVIIELALGQPGLAVVEDHHERRAALDRSEVTALRAEVPQGDGVLVGRQRSQILVATVRGGQGFRGAAG